MFIKKCVESSQLNKIVCESAEKSINPFLHLSGNVFEDHQKEQELRLSNDRFCSIIDRYQYLTQHWSADYLSHVINIKYPDIFDGTRKALSRLQYVLTIFCFRSLFNA